MFFSVSNLLEQRTELQDILFSVFGFASYLVILSELSTIQVFNLLQLEDYRWWWRAFSMGAWPAVFVFGVTIIKLVGECGIMSAL